MGYNLTQLFTFLCYLTCPFYFRASGQMYHQGLGFADYSGDTRKFRQNIESLLREYSRTDTTSDLIFCTDFTKEERKIIFE